MSEWRIATFRDAPIQMIDGDRGKNYPNGSDFSSDGYCLFLSARNVTKTGFLFEETSFISAKKDAVLRAGKLRRGDVVITTRGTVGNVAYFDESVHLDHVRINSGMLILRSDRTELDPRFLYFWVRSDAFAQQVKATTSGSAQPQLPVRDLSALTIPLPELYEQQAIAEVLGALDDKIAANTKLADISLSLAEEIFNRYLARNELSYQALGSVATTVLGGTPSRSVSEFWTDGTVAWLNSGKANEIRINEASDRITEEALRQSATKLMPKGSTLVAITGATLGQVARLEIEAGGNQSLVGIWAVDTPSNDWLYFAVMSEIPELLKRSTGAAQQHVNKNDVDSLKIPLLTDPALLEQFGASVRPLLDACSDSDLENRTLRATREALLPQLMSGKLRVKDAADVVGSLV